MLQRPKTFGCGLGARSRQTRSAGGRLCRVYFSLDYERDFERVRRIRACASVIPVMAVGFDGLEAWCDIARRGAAAVHGSIDDALDNTVATVVCIGARTMGGKYLEYELERSLERGNGLVGIKIHDLNDANGLADPEGHVPSLIGIAGYKTYKYTNKRDLVAHIHEAATIAVQQQQKEHQRQILIGERNWN